jgi:hypothetical protein
LDSYTNRKNKANDPEGTQKVADELKATLAAVNDSQ